MSVISNIFYERVYIYIHGRIYFFQVLRIVISDMMTFIMKNNWTYFRGFLPLLSLKVWTFVDDAF